MGTQRKMKPGEVRYVPVVTQFVGDANEVRPAFAPCPLSMFFILDDDDPGMTKEKFAAVLKLIDDNEGRLPVRKLKRRRGKDGIEKYGFEVAWP